MDPASAAATARDTQGRFLPGQSGNPAGKKPGTRNRATFLRPLLQEGELETAGRVIIEKALEGHFAAARFLVDGMAPNPRGRLIDLELPPGATADDARVALLRRVLSGEISTDEALQLHRLIEDKPALTDKAASETRAPEAAACAIEAATPVVAQQVATAPAVAAKQPDAVEPAAAMVEIAATPGPEPRAPNADSPAFHLHPQASGLSTVKPRAPSGGVAAAVGRRLTHDARRAASP